MGARRLAAPALVAVRPRTVDGGRPLEDAGQPAPHTHGARHAGRATGRMDAAAPRIARLERLRAGDDRAAVPVACIERAGAALAAHAREDDHAQRAPCMVDGVAVRVDAVRPVDRHVAAAGVVDGRRDRAYAVSCGDQPSPSARMDHGGRSGCARPADPRAHLSANARRRDARAACRGCQSDGGLALRSSYGLAGRAVRTRLACRAGDRVLAEPRTTVGGRAAGGPARCASTAARCAPDLALFRDVRDGGRSDAAAGQFPGGPEARRRAPDFAHQHRAIPAVCR